MNNLNYLVIEGHLCQDPVFKEPIPGKNVCKFTIAVNRSFLIKETKNTFQTETSFFPVDVWGDLAVLCQKYLRQGRGIRVVGHLKQQRWKVGENEYRQAVVIVAEHIEFMPDYRKSSSQITENQKEAQEVIATNANVTPTETAPADIAPENSDGLCNTNPENAPANAEPISSETSDSEDESLEEQTQEEPF